MIIIPCLPTCSPHRVLRSPEIHPSLSVFISPLSPLPDVETSSSFPLLSLTLLYSYHHALAADEILSFFSFRRPISSWGGTPLLLLLSRHFRPPCLSPHRIIWPPGHPMYPSHHDNNSMPPYLLTTQGSPLPWDSPVSVRLYLPPITATRCRNLLLLPPALTNTAVFLSPRSRRWRNTFYSSPHLFHWHRLPPPGLTTPPPSVIPRIFFTHLVYWPQRHPLQYCGILTVDILPRGLHITTIDNNKSKSAQVIKNSSPPISLHTHIWIIQLQPHTPSPARDNSSTPQYSELYSIIDTTWRSQMVHWTIHETLQMT